MAVIGRAHHHYFPIIAIAASAALGRFVLDGDIEDARQVAMKINLQGRACFVGGEDDTIDQRPDRFVSVLPKALIAKVAGQLLDLLLVVKRHPRMEQHGSFLAL
ncbi:MAG: hypothetical protein AB7O04_06090 [Hyphomonadaceae bacterium]